MGLSVSQSQKILQMNRKSKSKKEESSIQPEGSLQGGIVPSNQQLRQDKYRSNIEYSNAEHIPIHPERQPELKNNSYRAQLSDKEWQAKHLIRSNDKQINKKDNYNYGNEKELSWRKGNNYGIEPINFRDRVEESQIAQEQPTSKLNGTQFIFEEDKEKEQNASKEEHYRYQNRQQIYPKEEFQNISNFRKSQSRDPYQQTVPIEINSRQQEKYQQQESKKPYSSTLIHDSGMYQQREEQKYPKKGIQRQIQSQMARERQRQQLSQTQKIKERQQQKERQIEKEKVKLRELQIEMEREKLRERQIELEKQKQRQAQKEKQRQRELQQQRQRQMEVQRQREREKQRRRSQIQREREAQNRSVLSEPSVNILAPTYPQFQRFDWSTGQQDSIYPQMAKKDSLPSRSLTVINKFALNKSRVSENTDRKVQFDASRRHLMRDLLTGERDEMEPTYQLPNCGKFC